MVVASDRGFKKRKVGGTGKGDEEGSGWATIREPTPPPPADEEPMVVDTTGDGNGASASETSKPAFRGGLLSAKELAIRMAASSGETTEKMSKEEIERAQETVYRDTSGKKIDVKAEKAEAARKKREREEREAKKMQWGKGLVQREEEDERKKEEERIRGRDFVRRVDDEDLNKRQKEEERWNDPMAAFLTVGVSLLGLCISQLILYYLDVHRRSERRVHENLSIKVRHLHPIGSASSLGTGGTESVRPSLRKFIHSSDA